MNILRENMRRFKTKNLNEQQVDFSGPDEPIDYSIDPDTGKPLINPNDEKSVDSKNKIKIGKDYRYNIGDIITAEIQDTKEEIKLKITAGPFGPRRRKTIWDAEIQNDRIESYLHYGSPPPKGASSSKHITKYKKFNEKDAALGKEAYIIGVNKEEGYDNPKQVTLQLAPGDERFCTQFFQKGMGKHPCFNITIPSLSEQKKKSKICPKCGKRHTEDYKQHEAHCGNH